MLQLNTAFIFSTLRILSVLLFRAGLILLWFHCASAVFVADFFPVKLADRNSPETPTITVTEDNSLPYDSDEDHVSYFSKGTPHFPMSDVCTPLIISSTSPPCVVLPSERHHRDPITISLVENKLHV